MLVVGDHWMTFANIAALPFGRGAGPSSPSPSIPVFSHGLDSQSVWQFQHQLQIPLHRNWRLSCQARCSVSGREQAGDWRERGSVSRDTREGQRTRSLWITINLTLWWKLVPCRKQDYFDLNLFNKKKTKGKKSYWHWRLKYKKTKILIWFQWGSKGLFLSLFSLIHSVIGTGKIHGKEKTRHQRV